MEITYLGHACFMLSHNQRKILFDPFISANPLAASVQLDTIIPDYILLTHGHQDHVLDVATIYRQSEAWIVATFEVANWFQKQGLDRVHPMNHGGTKTFDFGKVKMVNAVHSSSMPDGSYGGHPAGYVLQWENFSIYFAGDTALHQDMKQIGEIYHLDVALLPIGDNFTMGVEDALRAADYLGCNKIIGMHYDTFPPIVIDHKRAKNLAESQGKELILMQIGSSIKF